MYGYYDYDNDPYHDRDYQFEVTCTNCGMTRSSLDAGFCSCGSSGETYASEDASRWNEHMRRTGR
jgi:hypothetical protein